MVAAQDGLELGLVATAFVVGLRHGVDWDHIAAIADVTGSTPRRRRAFLLALAYVVGHALVVALLGAGAVWTGRILPPQVDVVMERVVGLTLILLGVYVIVALARDGRGFRMTSRAMIVFHLARRIVGLLPHRGRETRLVEIEHEHEHRHDGAHDHVAAGAGDGGGHLPNRTTRLGVVRAHRHRHRHVVPVSEDLFASYGMGTAIGIGAIHGVGAETPTQMVLLTAAAGAGHVAGMALVAAFIVGLVASNTLIALVAVSGVVSATRNFAAYATIAVLTALFSVATGILFLMGSGGSLPSLAAG